MQLMNLESCVYGYITNKDTLYHTSKKTKQNKKHKTKEAVLYFNINRISQWSMLNKSYIYHRTLWKKTCCSQ